MTTSDVCVYCGAEARTQDHIPPGALFPHGATDLITVPSCEPCNGGFSQDDEYFIWTILVSNKAVGDEADRSRTRRFEKPSPRKRQMANRIRKDSFTVPVTTPRGLYLGHRTAYDVDLNRLDRVASRIVRGLYYLEVGSPVPLQSKVAAFVEPEMEALDKDTVRAVLRQEPISVANGAFKYWFSLAADRPDTAIFVMTFFDGVAALGLVVPESVSKVDVPKPTSSFAL